MVANRWLVIDRDNMGRIRESFLARFTPPDAANRARELLKSLLKQGSQSVAAYTNEFRRHLRLIPKIDKDDALFEYLRGLEKETSKQVRLRQPLLPRRLLSPRPPSFTRSCSPTVFLGTPPCTSAHPRNRWPWNSITSALS